MGSLAWLLRGGSLLASALSAVPTWKGFDPLPVLAREKRKDKKKRHDLETNPFDTDRTEEGVGRVLDDIDGSADNNQQHNRFEDRT
jgi:hypothetical protein